MSEAPCLQSAECWLLESDSEVDAVMMDDMEDMLMQAQAEERLGARCLAGAAAAHNSTMVNQTHAIQSCIGLGRLLARS